MGMRVERGEDPRLLTGRGRYVSDLAATGALHVAFARSPLAHARIGVIDTEVAQASPGVHAVWTAADVAQHCAGLQSGFDVEGLEGTVQPLLADGTARYVGEAVALAAAETAHQAEDAAALVDIEYEPLPAVGDLDAALAGPPLANDTLQANLVYDRLRTFGDPSLLDAAEVIEADRFSTGRVSATPMETRAYLAEFEWTTGRLTLASSTQMPHLIRSLLAHHLGIDEHRIRVIVPDVGGAFGQKGLFFSEEVLVCILARALDRPVRWSEDRRENLLVATHAKQQINEMTVGFDRTGRIVGLRDRVVGDAGAYQSCPFTHLVENMAGTANLTGVYKVPNIHEHVIGAMTNTCPIGAYRGIGCTAPQIAREALIDRAARRLGLSPFEIRRRNVVRPDEFPYTSHNAVYTEGSYLESIEALERLVDERSISDSAGRRSSGGAAPRAGHQRLQRGLGHRDAQHLRHRLRGDDPRHVNCQGRAERQGDRHDVARVSGTGT